MSAQHLQLHPNPPKPSLPQTQPPPPQNLAPPPLPLRHSFHPRPPRLKHQAPPITLPPRPPIPLRCVSGSISVGVVAADETRPVALHEGHDGGVHAGGVVGGWGAAAGIGGAPDCVDFDCVGYSVACASVSNVWGGVFEGKGWWEYRLSRIPDQ